MHKVQFVGLLCVVAGILGLSLSQPDRSQAAPAAPAASTAAPQPKPVEPSMHEFMEYVYKPGYLRLRTALAKKPRRTDWRKIKADVLVQAEGGNLLLFRAPKKGGEEWKRLAVENRELGAKLYAAARKSDYATARKHWETLIQNCNVCHTKFAEGKHQLKP